MNCDKMFNNMPNQNFCKPRDDMSLVNCDLTKTYKTCEPAEKLCRFAYASWCPVCDLDSRRRRSKSECIEANARKRCRDMKTQTSSPKKKDASENDDYLEQREKLDSSRVRLNLCELPTTYISNCQTNVPSNGEEAAFSVKFSKTNFVEPIYDNRPTIFSSNSTQYSPQKLMNSIKNGDIVKKNGFSKYYLPPHHLDTHRDTMSNSLDSIKNLKQTPNNGMAASRQDPHEVLPNGVLRAHSPKKEIIHISNSPTKHEVKIRKSPVRNMSSVNYYNKQPLPPRPHSPNTTQRFSSEKYLPNSPHEERSFHGDGSFAAVHGNYNNETEVRKVNRADSKRCKVRCELIPEKTKSPQLQDKVNQSEAIPNNETINGQENEVEASNGDSNSKRNRVRPRSDSGESSALPPEVQNGASSGITKKAREVSPLESKKEFHPKSVCKLSSIKNRHKISAIKLRKVRNKIAHSVSSDSNLSDSDFEELEDDDEKSESVESLPEETASSSNVTEDSVTTGIAPTKNTTDSGKEDQLPLRLSLFPNIPPYIAFASHDSEEAKLPTNVAKYLKWRLSTITPIVVRKTLSNTGFRLVRKSNDWCGTWGKHIKSVCFQTLKETQKLNHFPGTFQIGRKDRLWKNLQRLMVKYGQKEFGFIPRTFVLPQDLKLLRQAWEKTGNDKWIIKPPASARGTGIRVIHRWAHLPKKKSLVVQQYISNPYLINGSKFDLRLYVLVTSFNPLRIYLYPDGLARFASTKYSDDLSTLCDRYMHLTNYSINKLSSQYTSNEDANACKGHKWTLSKLWEYLEQDGVNTKAIWRSLQQLVIKTMLCGESSISSLYKANVNSRYNCYELFGVDVLLDERLKPWLLEVNISPSLHSASPLDLHVKGPLVQSLLNLAQFHVPPKMSRLKDSPPCLNNNLYSLQLTTKERLKQIHYSECETRIEYLDDIISDLTGDDVRHLTQAEDELTVKGNFERIFPTANSHYYFQFMEPRYYNRLFDAWENRYGKNRSFGIKMLQSLCEKKIHLVIGPCPSNKSSSEEGDRVSSPEPSTSEESTTESTISQPPMNPARATVDPFINFSQRRKPLLSSIRSFNSFSSAWRFVRKNHGVLKKGARKKIIKIGRGGRRTSNYKKNHI